MSCELDREVAEKVMGWHLYERGGGYWISCSDAEWDATWDENRETKPDWSWFPPPYSQDIGHAWLVVERMRELGWLFALDEYFGEGGVSAHFTERDVSKGGMGEAIGVRGQEPELICRAARAALGEDA